jgi:Ca2+-binding EF-hand superfamily protein
MRSALLVVTFLAVILTPDLAFSQGPPNGGDGFRPRGGGRAGGWDPAQMFDRFSNGKDVWIRSENPDPRAQGFFDRVAEATNITNGQITREQFTAYMQQQRNNWGGGFRGGRGNRQGQGDSGPGNGSPGAGNPGNGQQDGTNRFDQWAENMFRRLDANGDGVLNSDEMPEALKAERDKWDANKDGFIDLTEFKAYFQASMQQRMAENGGWNPNWQGGFGDMNLGISTPPEEEEVKKPVVYRAGNLPKDIPAWFQQYDTDGDGQIGLYEWKATGRSIEEFRKIDRNNDGFLTIDEVMRYSKASSALSVSRSPAAGPGAPNNSNPPGPANRGPNRGPRTSGG